MQLRAVDGVDAGGEYGVLLAHERFEKLRGHRRFDAHAGDILFGDAHGFDHAVGAVGRPEVEAQLVEAGFPERAQVLLVCAYAVRVHVLMDAGGMELCDDAVVHFDLHERFKVHVGNTGRRFVDGEQQFQIFLAEARAADLPISLADGLDAVERAVIIAKPAMRVALVGLADGAQPRSQQARAAAGRELAIRPDVFRAPAERLEPGYLAPQRLSARVRRDLDLRERGQSDLLLAWQQFFILRQTGEKLHPHQGVTF